MGAQTVPSRGPSREACKLPGHEARGCQAEECGVRACAWRAGRHLGATARKRPSSSSRSTTYSDAAFNCCISAMNSAAQRSVATPIHLSVGAPTSFFPSGCLLLGR
eukprot:4795606-Prymnesium_polylepis.1